MVDANVVSLKLRELADRISRVRLHGQPDSDADPELIHAAAAHGLGDLERYAAEVGAWMSRR